MCFTYHESRIFCLLFDASHVLGVICFKYRMWCLPAFYAPIVPTDALHVRASCILRVICFRVMCLCVLAFDLFTPCLRSERYFPMHCLFLCGICFCASHVPNFLRVVSQYGHWFFALVFPLAQWVPWLCRVAEFGFPYCSFSAHSCQQACPFVSWGGWLFAAPPVGSFCKQVLLWPSFAWPWVLGEVWVCLTVDI